MLAKLTLATVFAALFVFPLRSEDPPSSNQDKPFGGSKDVKFAEKLWKAMDGYKNWKLTTPVYKGASPHGAWLRLFSTHVSVDGKAYPIIVKENFGGRGVSQEDATKDPAKWLKAVTIMLQREQGYDSENQNWFYVKYGPDGKIMKNPKDMLLAGRVAKGTTSGCIACHSNAKDNDFLFSNDG